ncbi:MAG: aldolase catalytic domain-containing protein [Paludibacter sp.]
MNIKLLDCTMRDGGYNNDWAFGHDMLINLFERSTSAGIEFIEVGFIDDRRPFDINRSIMPDTSSAAKIWGNLDKKNTKVITMIDYGTCDLSHIQLCKDSFVDGIRVIFKMDLMHEALDYCEKLNELGYLVFAQGVSFTTYTDDKLEEIVKILNKVKPFAFSIVDTYGLMDISLLNHYYEYLDTHLDMDISIGFHAHNNFQLAFANCMELARKHGEKPRELLLDGSIYGMGKGAGNAPLELLVSFMNENFDTHYDINQILEAIDVNVLDLYKQLHWGYSLKGFISASNDCHPNYVSYLLDKKTLSVKSINEILQKIEKGPKKLLYDKKYVEQLYIDYQKNSFSDEVDYNKIKSVIGGNKVLLIGPGKSVMNAKDTIVNFIKKEQPIVLSINFIPETVDVDYLFLTNSKRYVQQSSAITKASDKIKIIATSNVTRAAGKFDINLDYESLIDRDAVFIDNSFIMALKVMMKIGVKDVALAGFDGYSLSKESDYFSSKMEYEFSKRMGQDINAYVDKILASMKSKLNIQFITPTLYKI